ncbi:YqeG family HAD IIIA-type phosphatase [Armatimonas sp.]|uniref:YqeG family HAD IIIA-type phosphatase n=1 Tax=Armatimonas sp. TaxID=1872638 RepID=UPI00286D0BBC|nr:YqeG family HAD IIIA-type phosphatase [Armatimonas sp.]
MSLLKTDRMVRRVSELELAWLAERGIRGIVSDLDNTLAAWHGDEIPGDILAWLEAVKSAKIGVCLCSNTRRPVRLARIAEKLEVHHVPGNAGKPGRTGVLKALELMAVLPNEALMVGDQLFTDMVAGNRVGLTTVLVNPLANKEFIGTKLISRNAEKLILRGERARPE